MPTFRKSDRAVGDRTAAERERERLDRELRRAQRAGRDGDDAAAGVGASSPVDAPAPEFEPEPEPAAAPEPEPPAAAAAPLPRTLPPPPTRRDAWLERRAARAHGRASSSAGTRGPIRRRRVLGAVALAVLGFVAWFLVSLFQPFAGSGHGRVVVDVPRGDSAKQIGDLLARRGVVGSGFFFDLRALVEGKRGELHSGVYPMRLDMTYSAAISELTKPPPPPPVVRVVIPEGDARSEIARIASADGLTGEYLSASARSTLLDPARYGAPAGTASLEGFLFPATYPLRTGTNVRHLVDQQLVAFQQNFGSVEVQAARRLHVTPYQLLTVASMIEREALLPGDRAKVAAVIYNRLRANMALGIDATIRYALNDWSTPLTEADLRIDSPYNTRTHRGLPPTPIGNPGLASIGAAEHPAHVHYLYYVAGADGCGELVFSSSYARFQRDAAAYQAALARNGGRVPTCHK